MANNHKPLTKAQWEILRTLQAFPEYRIYNPDYRAARLVKSADSYVAVTGWMPLPPAPGEDD